MLWKILPTKHFELYNIIYDGIIVEKEAMLTLALEKVRSNILESEQVYIQLVPTVEGITMTQQEFIHDKDSFSVDDVDFEHLLDPHSEIFYLDSDDFEYFSEKERNETE